MPITKFKLFTQKFPSWLWAIILYVGGVSVVALFSFTAHYFLSN